VVGVDVLGELGVVETFQAVVESGYGEALVFQPAAQPAFGEPPQDGGRFGEQREVVDLVASFGEPADDLCEVLGSHEGHRGDDRPVVLAQDQVQDLVDAVPPAGKVLEVPAQSGRLHAMQAVPDVLGVADEAALKSPVQFVGGLCLAAPEGAVDLQQHQASCWTTSVR
jgi:hypothetical protein